MTKEQARALLASIPAEVEVTKCAPLKTTRRDSFHHLFALPRHRSGVGAFKGNGLKHGNPDRRGSILTPDVFVLPTF